MSDLKERNLHALKFALGDVIMKALDDPDVVEIMLNDDGTLWVEALGEMTHVADISPDNAMSILNQVSSALRGQLSKEDPFVSGELPLNGERFEGIIPPVVEAATFAIRKRPTRIYTLIDYVRSGVLTFRQSEVLRAAIVEKKNILVIGGTGSGKTTFCNALLYEVSLARPKTRMLMVEDTKELQCALKNRVFMRASEWTDMDRIAKSVKRLRPDSISVGEVRDGAPTLSLVKLWNTGHPGGFATIHADSAVEGLIAMNELIMEVSANSKNRLISKAVKVAVYLEREGPSRKIKEIVLVKGYDAVNDAFLVENIV